MVVITVRNPHLRGLRLPVSLLTLSSPDGLAGVVLVHLWVYRRVRGEVVVCPVQTWSTRTWGVEVRIGLTPTPFVESSSFSPSEIHEFCTGRGVEVGRSERGKRVVEVRPFLDVWTVNLQGR